MITLRAGRLQDTNQLASLVYDSAPVLLPYLFGGEAEANHYIKQAMLRDDGQYSASRHVVACGATNTDLVPPQDDTTVLGCITLWHNGLNDSFHRETLASLYSFLSAKQLRHLLAINPTLMEVFVAPSRDELCIGHLAVSPLCQGNGIGQKLIAYALSEAKHLSKKRVVLDVDTENHKAISFYRRCDFLEKEITTFSPTQQRFLRMHYLL